MRREGTKMLWGGGSIRRLEEVLPKGGSEHRARERSSSTVELLQALIESLMVSFDCGRLSEKMTEKGCSKNPYLAFTPTVTPENALTEPKDLRVGNGILDG
jgi:hypothetical protein